MKRICSPLEANSFHLEMPPFLKGMSYREANKKSQKLSPFVKCPPEQQVYPYTIHVQNFNQHLNANNQKYKIFTPGYAATQWHHSSLFLNFSSPMCRFTQDHDPLFMGHGVYYTLHVYLQDFLYSYIQKLFLIQLHNIHKY